MANSAAATIDAIEETCTRIDGVCSRLDETGWHRPTALPAWDVHDVVAHLGSLEAMFLGREEPAHQALATGHVRNPLGALNENLVDRRREWSGAQVLEEFRETTVLRIEQLRGLDEDELDREILALSGRMMPQRDFLGVRLWDFFIHELDICAALELPPPLDTVAGRRVLDEMLRLVPRAAAKAGASDGAVVRLDISEPLRRSLTVRVEGGKGNTIEPTTAGEVTLHLRASPAAFLSVGAGRRDPTQAVTAGEIEVAGDPELAGAILTRVNVVP